MRYQFTSAWWIGLECQCRNCTATVVLDDTDIPASTDDTFDHRGRPLHDVKYFTCMRCKLPEIRVVKMLTGTVTTS